MTDQNLPETALRTVLANAPIAIFAIDRAGIFTLSEGSLLPALGLDAGQNVGKSALDLLGSVMFLEGPEPPTTGRDVVRRVLAGESVTAVTEFRGMQCENRIVPLRNAGGEVVGLIGTATDITDRTAAELALRDSEARMAGIVSCAMDAIISMDSRQRVLLFNAAAERMFGYREADMLGQPLDRVIPARFRRQHRVHVETFATTSVSTRSMGALGEIWGLRASGEEFPIEASISKIGSGTQQQFTVILRDVTERTRANQSLRASEARIRLLVKSSNVGLWDWNLVTNDAFYSPEWKRQLGYSEHELSNRHAEWESRLHPDDRESALAAVQEYLRGQRAEYDLEFRLRHKDGSWRWILARADVFRDEAGTPVRMMGCHIDITERKRAEDAMRQVNQRLRALSRRLLRVGETERRQLARELHDEIGQVLSATKISLQSLRRFPRRGGTFSSRLDDNIALVDRALQQVRSRSIDLHPPMLDDLGLVPALRWLADQQASRAGLLLTFGETPEVRFPPAVEIACFRVVQEAITNTVKHAGASTLAVALRQQSETLHAWVRDDGIGFDAGEARRRAVRGESLGLLAMEERAALVGGGVDWRSAAGRGTEVHAWFELDEAVK